MTWWPLLLGAGMGVGVLLVWAGLRPPRANVAIAAARWQSSRARSARLRRGDVADAAAGFSWRERIGESATGVLARYGVELRRLRADLEINGKTLEDHLAAIVLAAMVAVVAPVVIVGLLGVAGIWVGGGVPVLVAVTIVVVAAVGSTAQVRTDATRRREELQYALSSYLDLVAMSLAGGQSVATALPNASKIGTGWAFQLIGDTVSRSVLAGQSPARALSSLGRQLEVEPLTSLGDALDLTTSQGALAQESLSARADGLRNARRAAIKGKEGVKSSSMTIAQILLAVGFLAFLAFPAGYLLMSA